MNWKSFFRPDKSKIILTTIFVIFAIFGFFNFGHTCPSQLVGEIPCKQLLIENIANLSANVFGTNIGGDIAGFLQEQIGISNASITALIISIICLLVGLLFVIIYNYILAAIITSLYKLIRSK